jgi:hypothetical protein
MNIELDKHIKFKLEKNQSIEELTKQLRQVTQSLQIKTDELRDLKRDKDRVRTGVKELEM